MPTQPAEEPSRTSEADRVAVERLTAFSDGVVAIAITLLALDLPLPEGDTSAALFHSLQANAFDYVTFVIAFAVVGSHWAAHHRVFRYVVGIPGGLITLDLCWLLFITATPFLTRVLRAPHLTVANFALFAATQAVLLLVFARMQTLVARAGLFAAVTPQAITHHGWISGSVRAASYLASIPIFAVTGKPAIVVWLAVPIAFARLRRGVSRRIH